MPQALLAPAAEARPRPQPAAAPAAAPDRLREAYAQARAAGAQRHRDIAAGLGVSEAELIAAHSDAHADLNDGAPGLRAQGLRGPWPEIVLGLEAAGELMALTRNASCVHEKTGVYTRASAAGGMGLVLGEEIDLRVFYRRWAHGFAVFESGPRGVQRSLQFFDAQGVAIHKVFTRPQTDLDAWHGLIRRHAAPVSDGGIHIEPAPAEPAETPDDRIDRAGFHDAWASLRDTHDFFGLLKAHGLTRAQALRLAEPRFVQRVDAGSAQQLLAGAAASGTSIMVFTGNPGMIQIHSGPVHKVAVMGPWLNVLDARFSLHLREDHIAQAWVVRKPTTDGLVTSLELFDARGELIAMFFGARKPGKPELCAWRQLIEALHGEAEPARTESPCAA
jgi:putative hemin transport protein